jgi:hypothetical protein
MYTPSTPVWFKRKNPLVTISLPSGIRGYR